MPFPIFPFRVKPRQHHQRLQRVAHDSADDHGGQWALDPAAHPDVYGHRDEAHGGHERGHEHRAQAEIQQHQDQRQRERHDERELAVGALRVFKLPAPLALRPGLTAAANPLTGVGAAQALAPRKGVP